MQDVYPEVNILSPKHKKTNNHPLKQKTYVHTPGGQVRSEILTIGVLPMVSLMFSRGGPYPSPLAFARRTEIVFAFNRVDSDASDGIEDSRNAHMGVAATRAVAPNKAIFMQHFIVIFFILISDCYEDIIMPWHLMARHGQTRIDTPTI